MIPCHRQTEYARSAPSTPLHEWPSLWAASAGTVCQSLPQGLVGRSHWLEPGSDAAHLAFGIAQDRRGGQAPPPVDGFAVARYSCHESQNKAQVIWTIGPPRPRSTSDAVAAIDYGTVPRGYVETHPAVPITPGCYVASFDADGYYAKLAFVVTFDGAVLALR